MPSGTPAFGDLHLNVRLLLGQGPIRDRRRQASSPTNSRIPAMLSSSSDISSRASLIRLISVAADLFPDQARGQLLRVPAPAPPRPPGGRRGPAGARRGRSSPSGGWPRARRRCRRGSTRRRGSGRASAGRPGTSPCRRRPAAGRSRRAGRCAARRREISLRHLEQGHLVAGAGRALDLEVVAVEARTGSAAPGRSAR